MNYQAASAEEKEKAMKHTIEYQIGEHSRLAGLFGCLTEWECHELVHNFYEQGLSQRYAATPQPSAPQQKVYKSRNGAQAGTRGSKAVVGHKNPMTAERATSRGAQSSKAPAARKQVPKKAVVRTPASAAMVSPATEARVPAVEEVMVVAPATEARAPVVGEVMVVAPATEAPASVSIRTPTRVPVVEEAPAKAPGEGAFEFIKKTICGLDYVKNDKHKTWKQAVRFLMSKDNSGSTRWDWVVKDALKLEKLGNDGQLSEELKKAMAPFDKAIYCVIAGSKMEEWIWYLVDAGLIKLRDVEEVETARSITSGLLNDCNQYDEN